MARRKEPLKPLLATKHDFVESLDAVLQRAINLTLVARTLLDLGEVPEGPARTAFEKALAELNASIFTHD